MVEGIHGNILYTSDLEVMNISLDGAAIETTKRLELNREYTFKITYQDTVLNLRGHVVWAFLILKEKKDSEVVIPVYRAGIKFTNMLSEKANMLLNFIEGHKVKTLENRFGGVRFTIAHFQDIKIDLPHKYTVKQISLTGMLIETDYPLDIESHYEIELFLNENVIRIDGRIAYCEKIDEDSIAKYVIGVEFIAISKDGKRLLADFLNSIKDE